MCGILGGNIKNWNYEKGIEAIRHRGPDGKRVVRYDLCTLGFVRLAIMDLSENAMQPFVSNDGNVILLFNGEIYGFQELRRKLKKKYCFRTTSDTEVILYAYIEYGDDFIKYIDGMFSIVIYDRRLEYLKLYRDRYGIKPLYYLCDCGKFSFTSELKGFTAACQSKSELPVDNTAIYDYLAYQYIPEPKSMYKNVYKVEPASYLFYDLRKKKIVKKGHYWHLRVNLKAHGNKKKSDVLSDIRELFKQSIKRQMVADVPVGTFLSGGVDSSIVSYECRQINPSVESFTIGFQEKSFDESCYAQEVAQHCNIYNKKKTVSIESINNVKGILKRLYDEPFADTSAYPTYILSEFARQNVKVVLTGDGGDELFGGYERYKLFYERRKGKIINSSRPEIILNKIMKPDTFPYRFLMDICESGLSTYAGLIGIFDEKTYSSWKRLLRIDKDYDIKWFLRKYYHEELPPMTRMRYLDFKTYLPGDILTKVDRTSMSVSLEARVPFLDKDLVEYVFSLAEDECFYDRELKVLLKRAYEDVLPKDILYRKKRGFSVPNHYISQCSETKFATILKQEWKELVSEIKLNKRKNMS